MIQLTARGVIERAGDDLATLAREFASRRCLVLPALLEPSLVARIQQEIDRSPLYERRHGAIAAELCMPENTCLGLLHFLVNDSALFRTIEDITGRRPLTRFHGRVYRRIPGRDHFDSWHNDVREGRAVGLSLNLSTAPYEGGVFEIRREGGAALGAIANVGPGDALLFDIEEGLEHRVSPVVGAHAKTAFAGWFSATRDYLAVLRHDPSLRQEGAV